MKPTPLASVPESDLADGIDTTATPSTAAPSESSTPTAQTSPATLAAALLAAGEEKATASSPRGSYRRPCLPLAALAALSTPARARASRGPEPWVLKSDADEAQAAEVSRHYRELLQQRGRGAMQRSELWRPIAFAEMEVAACAGSPTSRGQMQTSLAVAQALGLMWAAVAPLAAAPHQASHSPLLLHSLSLDAPALGSMAPTPVFAAAPTPPLAMILAPQEPPPMFNFAMPALSQPPIGFALVPQQHVETMVAPPHQQPQVFHEPAEASFQQLMNTAMQGSFAWCTSAQIEERLRAASNCCYED